MDIKIEGLERLINELKKSSKNIERDTAQTIDNTANKIVEIARNSMPDGNGESSTPGDPPNKQSGDLAASIDITRVDDHSVSIGSPLDYGKDLEFGTSSVQARPWLRPAFEQGGQELIKDLEKDINEEFK